jgi:zinc transport system permease protein
MLELFSLPVFQRALAALLLSGIAYPSMGTIILALELVPARFAVMHASLLGAALGLLVGFDPTLCALIAALATGLGVARIGDTRPRGGGADSASGGLGLVMSLSLALAFIIFHKGRIHAIEAFNLFWGNILALRPGDLAITALSALGILAFIVLFFKETRAVLFDRELALSSGMPARALYSALIVLVCLGLGMAMRLTGALLADALTILPALAARKLRLGFRATLLWGGLFGLIANLGGFGMALAFDLPTGPAVILAASALVGIAALAASRRARAGRVSA